MKSIIIFSITVNMTTTWWILRKDKFINSLNTKTRGFPSLCLQFNDKKYKCPTQTVHSIEKIFIPTDLPFLTRRRARKVLDIALIKLGRSGY